VPPRALSRRADRHLALARCSTFAALLILPDLDVARALARDSTVTSLFATRASDAL
jgi:hypothetical protein